MQDILIKVRALVSDIEKNDYQVWIYRNNNTFKFKQPNITSIRYVKKNGVE